MGKIVPPKDCDAACAKGTRETLDEYLSRVDLEVGREPMTFGRHVERALWAIGCFAAFAALAWTLVRWL